MGRNIVYGDSEVEEQRPKFMRLKEFVACMEFGYPNHFPLITA